MNKKISAKDEVIKKIENYIISNNLKENDPLPTENELAMEFGISRHIIREGLQHFKSLGIIASKPKVGAFIKSLMPSNPFGVYTAYFESNPERLKEIAKLRMIIEFGSIPQILRKVTAEDIADLEEINERMCDASQGADFSLIDKEFHERFLAILDNKFLTCLKPLLLDYFNEFGAGQAQIKGVDRMFVTGAHEEMIKALGNKDFIALAGLVQTHYAGYFDKNFNNIVIKG